MGHSKIGLAEMVANLREELLEAEKAKVPHLKLEVEEIELEVQFVVSREAGVEGKSKLKFWVFADAEAGAQAKLGSARTQRLKMKLKALDEGNQQTTLSDKESRPKSR